MAKNTINFVLHIQRS